MTLFYNRIYCHYITPKGFEMKLKIYIPLDSGLSEQLFNMSFLIIIVVITSTYINYLIIINSNSIMQKFITEFFSSSHKFLVPLWFDWYVMVPIFRLFILCLWWVLWVHAICSHDTNIVVSIFKSKELWSVRSSSCQFLFFKDNIWGIASIET